MRLRALAVGILVGGSAARAQTTAEADYLRARRAAADAFANHQMTAARRAELGDLERRFRSIVGPVSVPGFRGAGHFFAAYTCAGDVICGEADAIQWGTWDLSAMVTTRALLPGAVTSVDSALASARFLADALGGDQMVVPYANLPIPDAKRRGVKSAMLMLRAQDDHADPPDRVLVTVARQSRIYIVQVPPVVKVDTLKVCSAPLDSTLRALMADDPTHKTNEFDRAWDAYRQCYQTNVSSIPGIDRIVRQVTALVDSLAPGAVRNYGLTDMAALQGRWRIVDARARMSNEPAMIIDGMVGRGTVEFTGDTITMRELGHGDALTYPFTLDTLAPMRTIRMTDWVGLYAVKGDTLRLSLPIEHFSDRPIPPAGFNAPNTAAYTFTRDTRPPR